jgi:adenylate kinase
MAVDFVPLGSPGCGKGTASKLIAATRGIPHISTGDMLRALDRDSDLGRRVFALIDDGDFVTDELAAEMVADRLSEPDAQAGVVLDGFPRTLAQLPIYDELCARLGRTPVFVELVVPEAVTIERLHHRALTEGRADDTPEVILKRLGVYKELTLPMVVALREAKRLHQIDARVAPEAVAAAMLAIGPADLTPGL